VFHRNSLTCSFLFHFQTIRNQICISDFLADEVIVATDCDHVFHKSCLKEWSQRARACPVCRSDIPSNECIPELVNASNSDTFESPTLLSNNNRLDTNDDNEDDPFITSRTSSDELMLEPFGMIVDASSSSSNNESITNDNGNGENSAVVSIMSTRLNECYPNVNGRISSTVVPLEELQPHNNEIQNVGSRVEEVATSDRDENTEVVLNTRGSNGSRFNWSRSLRLLGSYVPH